MSFWGGEVKSGKALPYVPPPESSQLRLTQATLGLNAANKERVALSCKIGNEEVLICSLREGVSESVKLDLVLDQYAELTVQSSHQKNNTSIHVAGYHVVEEPHPHMEDDDDDEGEDMYDEELAEAIKAAENGDSDALQALPPAAVQRLLQLQAMQGGGFGMDSDDDSEDDDEDMDSELDSEDELPKRKPSVIIEEIIEEDEPKAEAQQKLGKDASKTKGTKALTDKKGKESAKAEEAIVEQAKNAVKETVKGATKKIAALDEDDISDDEDEELDSEDEDEDEDEDEETAALLAAMSDSDDEEASEEEQEEEEAPKIANGKRKAEAAAPVAKSNKAAKLETKPQATEETKLAASAAKDTKQGSVSASSVEKPLKGIKKFPNGFVIENVSMGDPAGKIAKGGKKVVVKYIGKLAKTGKIFDQTKGNKTFTFRLGVGEVIRGWDEGVAGMRCGDKRKLSVPPQMAYGSKGIKGTIPGNSTLNFEVELIDVKG